MYDVIVIGAGPAGIFNALELSGAGKKVALIDAGRRLENKICPIESGHECKYCEPLCSIMGGFGGAQFFEGTKLSIFPAGSGLVPFYGSIESTIQSYNKVDEILERFGKQPREFIDKERISPLTNGFESVGIELKYYNAQKVSKSTMNKIAFGLQEELVARGVDIYMKEQVTDVQKIGENEFKIITLKGEFTTKKVVISVGRVGSRFLVRLADKLGILYYNEDQEIEIGVRVEMPEKVFREVNNLHNDLKLKKVLLNNNGELRTFCQDYKGFITKCVYNLEGDKIISTLDGHIIGTDEEGGYMSDVVNLAVHHRYKTTQSIDEIYSFIDQINKLGKPVIQSMGNFLENLNQPNELSNELSLKDVVEGDINKLLPSRTLEVLKNFIKDIDKVLPGFADKTNTVYAPSFEMGWKKFKLTNDFQSSVPGIYIIGDVNGHFRGAMQAMSSGLLCAEKILETDGK